MATTDQAERTAQAKSDVRREYVRSIIAAAPPLTDAQRTRLTALLATRSGADHAP